MRIRGGSAVSMSPTFIRLYLVTFFFFSANPIINIIIPVYSEAAGADNGQIGLMMGAYLMVSMLIRPWAGIVISRYGPLPILRILLIGNIIVLGMYVIVGLKWYILVRGLQGLLTGFFSLVLQMGIVDLLPEHERAQGLSLYLLAGMLPAVMGPLAGWVLWDLGGIDAFYISMLLLATITIALGYTVPLPSRTFEKKATLKVVESDLSGSVFKSWASIVRSRYFLVCSLVMLVASIGFGTVTTFLTLYTNEIGKGNPGLFFMLQASVMVAARFALRTKIPSDGRWHPLLIGGLLICMAAGIQLLSLAAIGPVILLYAASLLIGLGMALIYPILVTYLTFVLSATARNVLIGLFIAVSDLGIVMGNIIMGNFADKTSYSFVFMLGAILALLTGLFVLVAGGFMRNDAETKSNNSNH